MTTNKDAYYFSHDANARNDIKILRLRVQHKAEGYGIYWMIIEHLREQKEYKLLLADVPNLAYDLRCSEEVLTSIINDFDLFSINETTFCSHRLTQSMDKYNYLKQKRIDAGRKGGEASVKQRLSKRQANENDCSSIKVNEINESKGNNDTSEGTTPTDVTEEKATPIIWKDDQWQIRASMDLFRLMKTNNDKHPTPDFQKWASTMDMIERINGHDQKDIKRVLFFSQHDDFWKQTCHSPTNLRKNFIKIQEKAKGWTVNRETGDVYKKPNNEDIYGDHEQC